MYALFDPSTPSGATTPVRAQAGVLYRLVGFDAPETFRAQCPSERDLGNRATFRLRQIIAGGGTVLEPVPCSCRHGTEGTMACNHGRLCAILWVRQRNVASIMVEEGLARPYVCSRTKCPKREGWCGGNDPMGRR